MIKKYLSLAIILTFFNAYSQRTIKEAPKNYPQAKLQEQKINLEIEKLKKEVKTIGYLPILQSGTLIAALIAAAISLITATRSQKIQSQSLSNQMQQQERERFSELLKELGSLQSQVKISAILALSEYESFFPYIISSLRNENDQGVISLISQVLKQNTSLCIPILIEETMIFHQEQMNIACALLILKIDRDDVCSKLNLNNEELQNWYSTKYNSRNIESRKFNFSQVELVEDKDSELKKLEEDWNKLNHGYNNILTVIEELIRTAVLNKEVHTIKNGYLINLRLHEINLKNWKFENCDFSNSKIAFCNLENVIFQDIFARNISIRECNINNLSILNSSIKNSNFRNSKGKKVKFSNIKFHAIDFRGSNIRYSNYLNCKFSECNLEATMFAKSTFDNFYFFQCNFEAAFFQESTYKNVSIDRSDIKTTKFNKSHFTDCYFRLNNVTRSSFTDSTFTDVTIKKVQIQNSELENVIVRDSDIFETYNHPSNTIVGFKIINKNLKE